MKLLTALGFSCARSILFVFVLALVPSNASIIKAPSDGFWDTGMRLCDVDENGDCHNKDYALSISRFAIGGGVAALLTLLALVIFLPTRFCFNGCGGKNPSQGLCPSKYDKRYYTRNQIVVVKIATALLIIPIIIAVGIGFQSNSEISNSVNDITTAMYESGDEIEISLNKTQNVILQFVNDPSVEAILSDAVNTAADVSDKLHDIHDKASKYDKLRQSLMIIGFVLSVLAVIAGIVCAIFNFRVIALLLGIFGMVGLIILWLSFGIHLVAGKFVFDVCVDIDILTSNNTAEVSDTTSVFKTGALARLWACDNNTELVQLQQLIEESINTAVSSVCDMRENVCGNNPNMVCSPTPACSRDTLLVVTDAEHMAISDNGQRLSLNECATACSNSEYRNASSIIVTTLESYVTFTDIYYNTLLPILNCQLASRVLLEVKEPLCEDMFDSLFGVAVTNAVVGIFFVPFVILMIVGYKRFQSLDGGIV